MTGCIICTSPTRRRVGHARVCYACAGVGQRAGLPPAER